MGVSAASCRRAFRISAKRFILPFASLTTERLRRCYNPSRDRLPITLPGHISIFYLFSPLPTRHMRRTSRLALKGNINCSLTRTAVSILPGHTAFFTYSRLYPPNTSTRLVHKEHRRRRLCRPGLPCFWCSVCFRFPCGLCRPGEPGA